MDRIILLKGNPMIGEINKKTRFKIYRNIRKAYILHDKKDIWSTFLKLWYPKYLLAGSNHDRVHFCAMLTRQLDVLNIYDPEIHYDILEFFPEIVSKKPQHISDDDNHCIFWWNIPDINSRLEVIESILKNE